MSWRDSKYLSFVLSGAKGKTNVWSVQSRSSGGGLGVIQWYAPWRQYCFFPYQDTLYNTGCMDDISDFIKGEMGKRRKK